MEQTFVIKHGPSATESFAARELSRYLLSSVGISPLLEGEGDTFFIGRVNGMARPEIKEDGYVIRSVPGGLSIIGSNDRGTLYGVYHFLEEFLGCRFLTPDVELVPKHPEFTVPKGVDIQEEPAFAFRENQWFELTDSSRDMRRNIDFSAKMNNLGSMDHLDEEHGGNVVYPGTHTFNTLCPREVYFKDHPEYYSMVNGERIYDNNQLCLTNPDVLQIVTENLKKTIRECKNPYQIYFAVAQNDWYNECECPACAAIDEEEGSHAGTVIRFVNAVAEAIEPEFPWVIVDTLAYQYTRTAPLKTKPRHNVVVRICTIESCLSHPMRTCQELNCTFAGRENNFLSDVLKKNKVLPLNKDMADWGKICTHYNCWTYVTNFAFYMAPVPNLWELADNFRFFKENGITDLRLQGNRQSISCEMGSLRAYISAKLLWNPDRDTDMLIREFCNGYYRSAAAPIMAYLKMINDAAAQPGVHAGLYDAPWNAEYLRPELMEKAAEYFEQAKIMADDEDVLWRVKKAEMSVRFVRMVQRFRDGVAREDAEKEMAAFCQEANREYGVTYMSELGGYPTDPLAESARNVLNNVYRDRK